MTIGAVVPLILARSANSPPWPREICTARACEDELSRNTAATLSLARATASAFRYVNAAAAVAANRTRMSSMRVIVLLRGLRGRRSIRFGRGLRRRQSGVRHALRQQRHHAPPLRAAHAMPARDFGKRTTAAETEAAPGIDHANCDAWRFLAHSWNVTDILNSAQVRS